MILAYKLTLTGLGLLVIFVGIYTLLTPSGALHDFTLGLYIALAINWGIETVHSAWKKR